MDLYRDDKWSITAEHYGNRVVFYVEGPDEDGINDIFPWDRYCQDGPNFLFGTYTGVPKAWSKALVFKKHCPIDSIALPFFFPVYLDPQELPSLDAKFVECRADSILFYETLRMGRIPVLTSNDTKLPLDGFVNWDEILVRSPDKVDSWTEDKELAVKKAQKLSTMYFTDMETYIGFCKFLIVYNDGNSLAS